MIDSSIKLKYLSLEESACQSSEQSKAGALNGSNVTNFAVS